jgi:hypothetical protein
MGGGESTRTGDDADQQPRARAVERIDGMDNAAPPDPRRRGTSTKPASLKTGKPPGFARAKSTINPAFDAFPSPIRLPFEIRTLPG